MVRKGERYLFYYGGADANVGVAEAPVLSKVPDEGRVTWDAESLHSADLNVAGRSGKRVKNNVSRIHQPAAPTTVVTT